MITTDAQRPSYLIYTTVDPHHSTAGLAGRIKGITTVFILAVLLGKVSDTLFGHNLFYVCSFAQMM